LRAFCRGKLHLLGPPRGFSGEWNAAEYHRSVAERLGPKYAIVVEQSA
jgi:hypothetical protein